MHPNICDTKQVLRVWSFLLTILSFSSVYNVPHMYEFVAILEQKNISNNTQQT